MENVVTANTKIDPTIIKAIECRFAIHCSPPEGFKDDLHLVKEIIHTHDGQTIPNIRYWKNYKRPFWITKKAYQNHESKKEWEHKSRVTEYKCTQTDLIPTIYRALEQPWMANNQRSNLRRVARSPFLYGADILSTAHLKREYMEKFPDTITPFSVAVYDTETDVVDGTEEIIMATVSYRSKVYTTVQKRFVHGHSNVIEKLHALLKKHLGALPVKDKDGVIQIVDVLAKRGIEWQVEIADNEIDVVTRSMAKAHEWRPDFLAIWNLDFDITKTLNAIKKAGMEPSDIFSDPSVPKEYRFFDYKRGPSQKVTASGKVTPIKPAARWHTVFCPSSFYVIDAMCAYRHIRTGQAEESSYSLDSILKKHNKGGKLKFEEAEGKVGLGWHRFMQKNHPLEYIIYNVWDCVSMEELDEDIKDLQLSLPSMSGCSDFENFKSQPRRLVDELHFFVQKNDRVIGTTSDEMSEDLDEITIGLTDWIIMLPAHLVADNGLRCIEEYPDLVSNIRRDVGDLDVAASYPNGGAVDNISRETTAKELVKINGVDEYTQRMMGINLSGGHTNAVEICCGLFGLPPLHVLLEAFKEEIHEDQEVNSKAY
jgi:hypothetical protein